MTNGSSLTIQTTVQHFETSLEAPKKQDFCSFHVANSTFTNSKLFSNQQQMLQMLQAGTYKTVLCKFFEAGSCSRGASCTFAHGDEDLLSEVPAAAAAGAAAGGSACAVAATAWPMTSLADAIAQRRLESKPECGHG